MNLLNLLDTSIYGCAIYNDHHKIVSDASQTNNISNLEKKATVGARWAPTSYPQLLMYKATYKSYNSIYSKYGPPLWTMSLDLQNVCLSENVAKWLFVPPHVPPPKSGEPFPGCHVAPNKGTLSF